MSNRVIRYRLSAHQGGMIESNSGDFVRAEDFDRLVAELEQARAQLPAGGEAPEPVEIAAFLVEPDLYEPYVSLSRDSRCNGSVEALMTVSQHNRIVAQLAAAPHPVSGEQTIDQHNTAYWQEQYELLRKDYQRSLDERSQDVSGLIRALEAIAFCDEGEAAGCAKRALKDHRDQAQGGEK